jgi:hypothetical protein
MIRYLNTKINGQRETVDQLDSNDYTTYRDFKQAMNYLINEYIVAGGHGELYWSQRECK